MTDRYCPCNGECHVQGHPCSFSCLAHHNEMQISNVEDESAAFMEQVELRYHNDPMLHMRATQTASLLDDDLRRRTGSRMSASDFSLARHAAATALLLAERQGDSGEQRPSRGTVVADLAMEMTLAKWRRDLEQPHCIDCKGNGGTPARTHEPSTCLVRPRKPMFASREHLILAGVAVDYLDG
jgi:hypothetical protein